MNDQLRAYFALHICVVIWGFTAILGKLISLPSLSLVGWRVAICCVVLLMLVPLRTLQQLSKGQIVRMLGIGIIIGLHWICFYEAIKIANASIALASISTIAFFSAITEPFITRKPIQWYELALGIFVLPGMLLIVGELDWTMRKGLATGILCAFLAAIFTALNKREIEQSDPPALVITLIELTGALATLSVILAIQQPAPDQFWPKGYDWMWLLLLAVVCTVLPYYLSLRAMRHISAFAANLINNMEPVYGILLAILIFREDLELHTGFYIGVGTILLAIFSQPFLKRRFEKN